MGWSYIEGEIDVPYFYTKPIFILIPQKNNLSDLCVSSEALQGRGKQVVKLIQHQVSISILTFT